MTMSRWDGQYSSAIYSLAKELAKTNRIFYIDHPYTLKDFVTLYNTEAIQSRRGALLMGKNIYRKLPHLPNNFTAVTPPVTLPINWLPIKNNQAKLYDFFTQFNERLVFNTIRKIKKDHGIKDYIFINSFNPFFVRKLPADLKPRVFIYQNRDDISQAPHVAKHGVRLERQVINNADITLSVSTHLTKLTSTPTKAAHLLANAANTKLFEQAFNKKFERPPELQGIDKPVICYMGNISLRLNYNLLKQVAQQHADKVLLMLGPNTSNYCAESGLDKLPNVIITGSKRLEELPAYLQYVDCALIPFKYMDLTKGIYPLKMNEYLAAGIPVVCTNFSVDVHRFKDVVYIADDEEQFLAKVNQAFAEDSPSKRQARLDSTVGNSWTDRAEQFWQIIADFEKQKSTKNKQHV